VGSDPQSLVRASLVPRGALTGLFALAMSACAQTPDRPEFRPYDDKADAAAVIAAALADNPGHQRLLLTFGANWCKDSRALERNYQEPELAALLAQEFKVVHIDVGMFHRNLDITERYGNPIDKGIPSVVLLDAEGSAQYVDHGSLSSAESMSTASVRKFFERLATGKLRD
jgi:protein disulfide-isomerase